MRETAPYCTSMGSRGCLAKDRLRTYVRTYVYVYMHTYVYVYIIACPLLVVPWEGKPSRWFLAGVAHYIYRCYIYKAPHTYVYVCVCICQRRRCFAQDRIGTYVRMYLSVPVSFPGRVSGVPCVLDGLPGGVQHHI